MMKDKDEGKRKQARKKFEDRNGRNAHVSATLQPNFVKPKGRL
jgi:hypothetical protein